MFYEGSMEDNAEEIISKLKTELGIQTARLVTQSSQLKRLQVVVDKQTHQLQSSKSTIKKQESTIRAQKSQLSEQETKLAKQEVKLSDKESQLAKKDAQLEEQESKIERQKARIEWFERYLFGVRSEKRLMSVPEEQLKLDFMLKEYPIPELEPEAPTVVTYKRRNNKKERMEDCLSEKGLRFGPNVPVKEVKLESPEKAGLKEDEYTVIGTKEFYRIGQKPASYVVIKYVQEVIKKKGFEKPSASKLPTSPIPGSYADVSFLSGMIVEKFLYHSPLYRQHQRIQRSGITLNRAVLTRLTTKALELLKPIYTAQLSSALQSKVLAMDETSILIKHPSKKGMKQTYFWPIYGDKDEVCFPWSTTRGHHFAKEILGEYCGVLLSDGYQAYATIAKELSKIKHAVDWVHARRKFEMAEKAGLKEASPVMDLFALLFKNEAEIKELNLSGDEKAIFRTEKSIQVVDEIFKYLRKVKAANFFSKDDLLYKAIQYSLEREQGLRLFLSDPDIPLDTNFLERALRCIPMGRKNWLFCWTELGAEACNIAQSLIQTCLLHGIDPYVYFIDVLQRIDSHPMKDVHLLTPRLWKQHFASKPLSSVIQQNS